MLGVTCVLSDGVGIPTQVWDSQPRLVHLVMTGVFWDPLGSQGAGPGKQFVSRCVVNKVIDVQNSFFFSLLIFFSWDMFSQCQ